MSDNLKPRPLTLGEYRVGINFNVEGHTSVDSIKRKAADLIDELEALKPGKDGETIRCLATAQTEVEGAAMWAVKGATKKPR